ncbi:hypothetical protein [Azospirillum sp. SYSU D00513]|uniref:hypothetical protein n=1 Tax=Azospirillum sp. SYSU D00513 TaxID=2812561 RepID=UPI001A9602DA
MPTATVISEKGSFRLVTLDGRYAVVEARDGMVYRLEAGDGERACVPDGPEAAAAVLGPEDWTDEAAARGLFEEISARGERLAQRIW